tara:strand:+ start:362 stop:910 length:549 start_codon:yes stop_codon:yes gene_type:complete
MDVTKAIYQRRTVHLFEKKKINENLILDAINAANQAPCHKLTFPWRFYSVGLKKRIEILDFAITLKSQIRELDDKAKNIIREKFLNPSHLLIASQILNDDKFTQKEDYAACSCAIQNLSISLASNGISTKWSTGEITRCSEIYDILNLDSINEEIIGFIWIGYGKKLANIKRPFVSQIYKVI